MCHVNVNNDAYAGCPNSPSNGGSGICNCTVPYFHSQSTPGWFSGLSIEVADTVTTPNDGNTYRVIDGELFQMLIWKEVDNE